MIDEKDRKILVQLQENSNLSTYKIAKKTNIPQGTVLNRIRKLKESGVIERFTVDINPEKIGKNVKVLIFVKVNKEAELTKDFGKVGLIEASLVKHHSVLSVKRLMGKHDFVVEAAFKDVSEINDFLINKVRSLESVSDTETVVILNEWKEPFY